MIATTTLADAEVLAVSARTGQGIGALRARLETAAALARDHAQGTRFRLAVDRVFTLAGVGVVVTGTVRSGSVRVGDRVLISPSGLVARVRSLHAQNRNSETAQAGDRCALGLSGPDVAKEAIRRGDVALDPELHAPTDRIDALLRVLPSEPKPIGQWFPVRLHHAAAEVGARIAPLGDGPIAPGAEAEAQLVLDRPIAAAAQDRFVVRDVSAQRTLGGGRFLDLRPPARKRRTPERRAQRAALAIADPTQAFAALLAAPPFAADLAVFARDRGLTAERTEALAAALDLVVLAGDETRTALAPEVWRGLRRRGGRPRCGPSRRQSGPSGRRPGAAQDGAAAETAEAGVRRRAAEARPRRRAHARRRFRPPAVACRFALRRRTKTAWAAIAPLLGGEARFRPPRVRDIAGATGRDEADVRRLLKRASRMGRADEVAHDHFFLRSTVREMTDIVADLSATIAGRRLHRRPVSRPGRERPQGRDPDPRVLRPSRRDPAPGRLAARQPASTGPVRNRLKPLRTASGGESSPVGRPDFKSGWGSEPVSGGFDSHSPSPPS